MTLAIKLSVSSGRSQVSVTAIISDLLLLMKSARATDLFLIDLMFIRLAVKRPVLGPGLISCYRKTVIKGGSGQSHLCLNKRVPHTGRLNTNCKCITNKDIYSLLSSLEPTMQRIQTIEYK